MGNGSERVIPTHEQDPDFRPWSEEIFNSLTHGLGFIVSILGAVFLARSMHSPAPGDALACAVYATTLIGMYAISTLSHLVQSPATKHKLRIVDQGVIYLVIAGTYTPLLWAYLPTPWRVLALLAVWIAAFAGKYGKVVAQHRISDFSTQTYLWLGWFPALMLLPFVPRSCFAWLLVGGLCYTIGTVFLMNDKTRWYFHSIWHVFVIMGSASHFYAIYRCVVLSL